MMCCLPYSTPLREKKCGNITGCLCGVKVNDCVMTFYDHFTYRCCQAIVQAEPDGQQLVVALQPGPRYNLNGMPRT